ncbi:MAG TPA: alpha/beta fold hydrolase [Acidimicrobiia bacterium]|nr:alpha/beta fold hydrolase [Acidimicrobiia bacterium]
MRRRRIVLCMVPVLLGAIGAGGDDGGSSKDPYAGYESEVYADDANWLCRPDVDDDMCDGSLDTSVVNADGSVDVEQVEAAEDPPVDCFYIYPTVSLDPGDNSDLVPDPELEGLAVRNQVMPLAPECRVFAPVYRQQTLTSLLMRVGGSGAPPEGPREIAYADALDAWKHYIANDNDGRGVVLVGHSQGASVLRRLVAEEIDGNKALRGRLVSALLLGSTVAVPAGEDVGGDFDKIPLCRKAKQVGCVITYASFRATDPPEPGGFFGRAAEPGQVAGCTNPAALGGGKGTLEPYFETVPTGEPFSRSTGLNIDPVTWTTSAEIDTYWVTLPDFVEAECVNSKGVSYLEITVNGDPADPRVDDIGGDLPLGFGLHIVDANLGMGDFLEIIGRQAKAHAKG